jgi:hypothetical protein
MSYFSPRQSSAKRPADLRCNSRIKDLSTRGERLKVLIANPVATPGVTFENMNIIVAPPKADIWTAPSMPFQKDADIKTVPNGLEFADIHFITEAPSDNEGSSRKYDSLFRLSTPTWDDLYTRSLVHRLISLKRTVIWVALNCSTMVRLKN